MLEAYEAYGDYATMMETVESLIQRLALKVAGTLKIEHRNAQGEVYLPDVLPIISGEVGAMVAPDATVVQGINTRADLAECEAVIQNRLRHALMVDGVTMPDPSRVLVDAGVTVGQDTTLWPGTVLRGATAIGEGCANAIG
jgi:bifunctional UDP-N-acetylglucosamine pyrophosphorylase/glucosamine-1-phosphate N-acetyltransferase